MAQISPPGLGVANTADWFAIGVRQQLDTTKKWQSMSYAGMGRKSNPDNYNLLSKPAILVLNQEFYNRINKHWQNSFALSYRRQDEYGKISPYEKLDIKQEYRVYGRLAYTMQTSRTKFVPTFRQEFRKFYSPDFKRLNENFQLRSRFRLQLTVNLNPQKTKRIIASSEQLFSISKEAEGDEYGWTDFKYRESRFTLYYSFPLKNTPLIFDIGYMYNLVGYQSPYSVHYLAFDIILENPFKAKYRKRDVEENLE